MSDPTPPKETRPHRAAGKGGRDARAAALEKALRDNLRRRKAAAGPEAAPPSGSEASGQGQSLHEKAKEKPEEGA